MQQETASSVPRLAAFDWRVLGAAALALHGAAALGWWATAPGGFPPAEPRFWTNAVLPPLLILLSAAGLWGAVSRRHSLLSGSSSLLAAGWAAASVSAFAVYPASARVFGWLPTSAALLFAGLALWGGRLSPAPSRARAAGGLARRMAALTASAVVGGLLPAGLRAPDPDTRPAGVALPPLPSLLEKDARPVAVSSVGELLPPSGAVRLRRGPYRLLVQPLLTFRSRSPDRCWTLFAPVGFGEPGREYLGRRSTPAGEEAHYRSLGREWLSVRRAPLGIEARCELPVPVYSHLNAWCSVRVEGARRLRVAFSPCAGSPVDVLPADYPEGRPARLACLDGGRRFRVLQARTGEKGPFRELAAGSLVPGEPLMVMLLDRDRPICRLAFADWASQASTQRSPTAGWGVPVNAIEFERESGAPEGPGVLRFTLAGTSVGRGWDSVGHRAGLYRNRVAVTWP